MLDYKEIGARIKWKRKEKGITQESLAERVDISTVYLSKIENGHVHPALDLLDAICGALDCEVDILFPSSGQNRLDILAQYQNELVLQLFRACSPQVKPIVLELLEKLSKLQ